MKGCICRAKIHGRGVPGGGGGGYSEGSEEQEKPDEVRIYLKVAVVKGDVKCPDVLTCIIMTQIQCTLF